MKKIIGISGKQRSGKNSVAEVLESILSSYEKVVITSFADRLKKVSAIAMGLPVNTFFADSSKAKLYEIAPDIFMTGREILQKVGTDCFRNNIHDDFWVYSLMSGLNREKSGIYIIPDVRFPNEFKAIRDVGGYVIRVVRPGFEGDDHISETALDGYGFDFMIYNDCPLKGANFIAQVEQFIRIYIY